MGGRFIDMHTNGANALAMVKARLHRVKSGYKHPSGYRNSLEHRLSCG